MGKTGKALKKRRLAQFPSAKIVTLTAVDVSDDEPDEENKLFLGGLVSESQLSTTIKTLSVLANSSETLSQHRPQLKRLRGAVHDFQRITAEQEGTGSSLTSRISSALSGDRWTDAKVLLAEMRIRKQRPKLGALQRWTRECDAASTADGSEGDREVLSVLDAIMRTAEDVVEDFDPIKRHPEWVAAGEHIASEGLFNAISNNALFDQSKGDQIRALFRICSNTPGPERRPPNLHPAIVYASCPNAIPLFPSTSDSPLSCTPPTIPAARRDVPHVPGAFLLTSILSPSECTAIVTAASALGFTPDQPAGGSAVEMSSVLASNVYWLADKEFLNVLWSRVLPFLPAVIAGKGVRGLNARFRVYRYVPGAIYRPHLDGAWPASGLDPVTGEYVYDSSPPDDPLWSRLTFLIYLNDEFSNGQTTFFVPSSSAMGVMDARPVKPRQGSILVFPHGETHALLHEGSPVTEGGKFVIRTDVLYTK
ncbi:hypothetical protein PILCRDRAFT_586744 [Piloderma croceum F 1598]|uniref:Fe2OG dioxygenase domain-containing protein n=1 Tax=Piloderma croceum (strain F 1598) TaxID=765440 RepID=A0A0C3FET7_PILCF|nr:hypothetical protein PILCRDRAFT_586744 [Piloderma croceum F 1598]